MNGIVVPGAICTGDHLRRGGGALEIGDVPRPAGVLQDGDHVGLRLLGAQQHPQVVALLQRLREAGGGIAQAGRLVLLRHGRRGGGQGERRGQGEGRRDLRSHVSSSHLVFVGDAGCAPSTRFSGTVRSPTAMQWARQARRCRPVVGPKRCSISHLPTVSSDAGRPRVGGGPRRDVTETVEYRGQTSPAELSFRDHAEGESASWEELEGHAAVSPEPSRRWPRGSLSRHWLRRRRPRRSSRARPASSFSFPCAARRYRSRKAPSATRSRQATGRPSISTWSTSTSRTHRSFATPRRSPISCRRSTGASASTPW